MSEPDFQQIESVFQDALARPVADREAFVRNRCGDDEALATEVLQLLASFDDADDFLETGIDLGRTVPWGGAARVSEMAPGSVVGPFRLVRLLGAGGGGAVYEAEQEHPRRRVALKLVRMHAIDAEAQRRFEYEATILAQLHHPNIAQIYEAGRFDSVTGPLPWFAMELVQDALDLLSYADRVRLDDTARLRLFQQVCDAADYGHRRGVVHRDLKPGNILVDGSGRPRIIDFGVARVTDVDLMATTIETQVGQLIGTAQYMSPEQWQADPARIDGRADVYSLGGVLYELLVGRAPHDLSAVSLAEAQRIVLHEPPAKPSTIRRDLLDDLDTILLRALAKDRERRYASPGDLARDIGRFLDHEPIEARPPSALYHLGLFTRRNKTVVVSLSLIALVLVVATVVSAWFAIDARESRDLASKEAAEADRLFAKGRRLTRWVIDDFFRELANVPGGTRAKHALTSRVLEYLDGLVGPESDRELRREVAAHYVRLGELQGDPEYDNVGTPREALTSFERARSIYADMPEPRAEDRVEVAAILHRSAGVREDLGRHDEAARDRDQAIALLKGLCESTESSASIRRAAAVRLSIVELAIVWRRIESGQLQEARTRLEVIRERQDDLLRQNEEDVDLELTVLTARSYSAELSLRTGDVASAERAFRAVLDACERSAETERFGLREQQHLAQACISVGDAMLQAGKLEQAQRSFARALAIRARLASEDPDSFPARRRLAVAHQRLGDALLERNRLASARKHYSEDHAFALEFANRHPGHRAGQRALWISCDKLATCDFKLGRFDEARVRAAQGLAVASQLAAGEGADLIDIQGMAQAHTMLGTLRVVAIGATDDARQAKAEARTSLRAAESCWARIAELGELTEQQQSLRAANQKILALVAK